MSYKPIENELFHVHTYRCKHASDEMDYKYVDAAIAMGAPRIVFTDHTPFPGDPFRNRMDYEELPEYVSTINELKKKYEGKIEILCGLEVEYLPSYLSYFKELRQMDGMDLLIIGQHFYEHKPGSFSLNDEDKTYEYAGQCEAMAQGVETGLFDVVAHPDRSFRKTEVFGEKETAAASLITAAVEKCSKKPYLEKNVYSKMQGRFYREEFWALVPKDIETVIGLDAHSVWELLNHWGNR